jgi:hypothetical protein
MNVADVIAAQRRVQCEPDVSFSHNDPNASISSQMVKIVVHCRREVMNGVEQIIFFFVKYPERPVISRLETAA